MSHQYRPQSIFSRLLLFGLAFWLFPVTLHATKAPVAQPAQVETLRMQKSGSGAQLTWTDTLSPYVVVRNFQPNFSDPASLMTALSTPPIYFDPNVGTDGFSYFWIIADTNSDPMVLSVSPANPKVGDTVTLTGYGLNSAAVLDAGFNVPTLTLNTANQISFVVPAAGLVSGPLTISTLKGGNMTAHINFDLDTAASVNRFGHIAFDPATNAAYYSDRVASQIFKFSATSGAPALFGTVWPTKPTGLAIAPWQGSGNFLFVTAQVPVSSSPNGNTYRYDLSSGVRTLVGPLSVNGTTDPADARALYLGPDPAGSSGSSIFALTIPNTSFPSYIRHLTPTGTLPARTAWQIINANGGVNAVNAPGGLVVAAKNSLYLTNGLTSGNIRSSLEYWLSNGATPPVRTNVFTSDYTNYFITNAAQLAAVNPNPVAATEQMSIAAANRGNPTAIPPIPGSLVKLNLVQTGTVLRANPRAIQSYVTTNPATGQPVSLLGDVRGVAAEYALDSSGATNYTKTYWITNDTAVRKVRALSEVRAKIWVATHAGNPFPPNLLAAPPEELNNWISASRAIANLNLNQVGFQMKIDPVIGAVDDSNVAVADQYSIALFSNSSFTQCGTQLTAWAATPGFDPNVLNIFIVHGIRDYEGRPILTTTHGAEADSTFSNYTCGGFYFPIILLSYGGNTYPAPGSISSPRITAKSMAHEIGHFLIDYSLDTLARYDALTGHINSTFHMMDAFDDPTAVRWEEIDSRLINNPNNRKRFYFYPEGGPP